METISDKEEWERPEEADRQQWPDTVHQGSDYATLTVVRLLAERL